MADEIMRLADDGNPHAADECGCDEQSPCECPAWMHGIMRNNDLKPTDEDDLFADWQDTGGSD